MSINPWQPISLDTPWSEVAPSAVLFYDDEWAAVVDARRKGDDEDQVRLKIQYTDGTRVEEDAARKTSLGKTATKHQPQPGELRAMSLPAVIWSEDHLLAPRNVVALIASTIPVILFALTDQFGMFYLAILAGGALAMGIRRMWRGGYTLEFVAPDRLGITMDTVHDYALAKEQGKLWVPPNPGGDRRQLAFRRVEAIRDTYLALREDVVERIEHSALFDPAVPATSEFEAALVAFQDVQDATPTDRVDALASEVEVTFNVAQANAERLGLEHLPEGARDDARRAGKAARLAAGATTDGERRASLRQVKRILDSLALYYLPALDERLELEPPRDPADGTA